MRRRALIKDPIAFFAAEWLADAFASMNVVLVRHPAAFASSLKRLDWRFDFRNLLGQEELMASLLKPFDAELRAAARGEPDVIDQAILAWRVFAACTIAYRELHPDWLVLRYEDLAADPVAGFRSLYERLELTWSLDVEQRIERLTGGDNVTEVPAGDRGGVVRHSTEAMWTWLGRLTPVEIDRVREGTADLAPTFYGEADWRRSDATVGQ